MSFNSKWLGSSIKKENFFFYQKWYVLDCFKRLSFYFIKKKKKKKINKIFKILIRLQEKNDDFWLIIYKALLKSIPLVFLRERNTKQKNKKLLVLPLRTFEQQRIGNFWLKRIVERNNSNKFYNKLRKE